VTIRKGEPWGEQRPLPADAREVSGDAELADLVADARRAGTDPPPVALLGGDLHRTLGGGGDRRRLESGSAVAFPLDVGLASLDGGPELVFVAHLVCRRALWSGPFAVVMNGAWVGEWYLGPRAHPNDGLLDLTEGALAPTQRLLARSRVRTGSHLPHPALRTRRSAGHSLDLGRPVPVHLDGRRRGRARRVEVRCEPDALWCWV
jgi:hypothetical protein